MFYVTRRIFNVRKMPSIFIKWTKCDLLQFIKFNINNVFKAKQQNIVAG